MDLYRELNDLLRKIHPIEPTLLKNFLRLWEEWTFKKNEYISQPGIIDQHLFYIGEGFQKSYFVSEGKEQIVAFSYGGQFNCNPESFITNQPSIYYLECIGRTKALGISRQQFFTFLHDNPEFEIVLRKKLIRTIEGLVNRYHRLLVKTMEERFMDLMSNSPHLLNNVPQKDLANYLKMDPTNFSKLINSVRL